jgi:choline dehydrogenase-like flavoprotein
LLLRSRPWLGDLSGHLGQHLSANGDYALAALLPEERGLPGRGRMEHHKGVAMDTVCYEWLESHGFIVITQHQLAPATLVNGDTHGRWWGLEKKRLMEEYGHHLVGLAVIGVDGSPGRVETTADPSDEAGVTPAFGVSGLDFPLDRETRALFDNAREIVGGVVRKMGGTLLDVDLNLHPGYESMAFSAHPLGTARMSDSPADGVVDDAGRVHGHPGLNVIDGSIVPTALGVNPSLTIAAIAERAAHLMVRRLGGRPSAPPVANPHVRPRAGEGRRRRRTARR